jgi:hypothetical protein
MRVGTTDGEELQVVLQVVERADRGALASLTRTCRGQTIIDSSTVVCAARVVTYCDGPCTLCLNVSTDVSGVWMPTTLTSIASL